MPWPTWQQALVLAVVCALLNMLLRRRLAADGDAASDAGAGVAADVPAGRDVPAGLGADGLDAAGDPGRSASRLDRQRWVAVAVPLTRELGIIAALYSFWRVAKHLPWDRYDGAFERALTIVDIQSAIGLPSELVAQDMILAFDSIAWLSSAYYAGLHVPATIACLVWLFARHRERFSVWRNRLALLTLGCMLIRFVHVAPPRFFPELGFIDVAAANGMDVYGPIGTGVSAQTVAMPSIHVAWAAWVAFAVVRESPSTWRWLVAAHFPITFFLVAATGHHWWLDGIVAVVLLGLAVIIDRAGRAAVERLRMRRVSADEGARAPSPVG